MYKTRRQSRYQVFLEAHFLPFERSALSRVSIAVPYMKGVIKKRIEKYNQFIAAGGTEKKWAASIRKLYKDMNWRRKTDRSYQTAAFRMLKAAEQQWKYRHPSYDSPWEKRQKSWHDFMGKIDRTYEIMDLQRSKVYKKTKQAPARIEYLPEGGARIIG